MPCTWRCAARPRTCPALMRVARAGAAAAATSPSRTRRWRRGRRPAAVGLGPRHRRLQHLLERRRATPVHRRQHRRRAASWRRSSACEAPGGRLAGGRHRRLGARGGGGGARAGRGARGARRATRTRGRELRARGRGRAGRRGGRAGRVPRADQRHAAGARRGDDPTRSPPTIAPARPGRARPGVSRGARPPGCGARVPRGLRAADGREMLVRAGRGRLPALVPGEARAGRGHARRRACCAGADAIRRASGRWSGCSSRARACSARHRLPDAGMGRARLPALPRPLAPACRRPGASAAASPGWRTWRAASAPAGPPALGRVRSAVWLEGGAREAVHHLKYDGWPGVAARAWRAAMRGLEPLARGAVLVPVPLARRRAGEAGLQSGRGAGRRAGAAQRARRCARRCCSGRGTRRPRRALTPEARAANVRGAFMAGRRWRRVHLCSSTMCSPPAPPWPPRRWRWWRPERTGSRR